MIILHQIPGKASEGVILREFNEDSLLVEDLSAESADVANIIAALEEKYQITVTEPEIAKIRTPADLFELVKKHTSR
jgi:acyl carrier protein